MRDQGEANSGGPSRTEEGASRGCLPLGGGGVTGAWGDREHSDGRGSFVVEMHTALSWTVGTHRAHISALLLSA